MHVEQTEYSSGYTSFSYQILLPSFITRTVQETHLKTSTPPEPPPHTSIPMPSPPVHVPYVAPSITLPSIPPPTARPHLPVPPTPELRLPNPTFMPHPRLLTRPPPPSRPPVPSPKTSEKPIYHNISLHSFMEAIDK